jgi:hypothetical protein
MFSPAAVSVRVERCVIWAAVILFASDECHESGPDRWVGRLVLTNKRCRTVGCCPAHLAGARSTRAKCSRSSRRRRRRRARSRGASKSLARPTATAGGLLRLSEAAAPLTELGSPTTRFAWMPAVQVSFDALQLTLAKSSGPQPGRLSTDDPHSRSAWAHKSSAVPWPSRYSRAHPAAAPHQNSRNAPPAGIGGIGAAGVHVPTGRSRPAPARATNIPVCESELPPPSSPSPLTEDWPRGGGITPLAEDWPRGGGTTPLNVGELDPSQLALSGSTPPTRRK